MISPYREEGQPLLSHPGDSALNWYSYRLAQELGTIGQSVTVVGPQNASRASHWVDGTVSVIPCYQRGSVMVGFQIADCVLHCQPDIVHLQHELYAYGGLASALAFPLAMRRLRKPDLPLLTTIHGVIPLAGIDRQFVRSNRIQAPPVAARLVWRSLIRRIASVSDAVHVPERRLADLLVTDYGISGDRVHVIPHGVEASGSRHRSKEARQSLLIPEAANVALFFGYLAAYKGVAELLRDIPTMLAALPNLHVVIAGQVPDRLRGAYDIDGMMKDLGNNRQRLHVLGFVPEDQIPVVFAAADVLVLPYTIAMSSSGPSLWASATILRPLA